ncbi:X-Pro dipeptidyl-peptidase C-terminal non-catalytic domain-containing protein [Fusarium austroafricanum]|uniref:X-Pro dipeptidyl-peptidase C-terminal non-catalytic domain-containing protein n=1 Tax=Fusarium austroafricanum TaxID=2364996 RepID=A0A8H4JKT9_9HYPO|nr:X-Pro dipeptidyl-peptidase C-terminal non-catalytic domain-containing protein [Fusarium austroafricanum]
MSAQILNRASLEWPFPRWAFVGLNYQTPSYSGITDKEGRFSFRTGEYVTFSIKNLTIGTAAGAPSLTLASLVYDANHGSKATIPDITEPSTINRARFLQSLSQEADLRNGVPIDDSIRKVMNADVGKVSFTFAIDAFEQVVSPLFRQLGYRLRGAAEARNHLRRGVQGIKLLRDVRLLSATAPLREQTSFTPLTLGIGSRITQADYDASEEREAEWFEKSRDDINVYFRHSEAAVSAKSTTWVPRSYALVRVDGRGVGRTSGKLEPFSHQEARDFYDAIQWTAEQPCAEPTSSQGHCPPLASDADAYRELAYPGGVLLEKYRKWWFSYTVDGSKNSDSEPVDFLGGLLDHPYDDEHYHGAANLSTEFSKIRIPILTSLPSSSKQLLVWDATYVPYMYGDSAKDIEDFFDRHLKGKKVASEPVPVRLVHRTGDGKFEWLIGRVMSDKPQAEHVAEYSADVTDSSKELPSAIFESEPLSEKLDLAGHFRATLWVSSSSSDADIYIATRVMDGDREVLSTECLLH